MASGDTPVHKQNMTFACSKLPVIGAFVDYVNTSIDYLRSKSFAPAERLQATASRQVLSATFVAFVCLMLGMVSNVKFEVVTFNEEPLSNDLHFVLMSKEEKLYIDDIDVSRVMWCIEASDTLVILFSTLLIWNTGNVRSPISEYLFLPWLGATLRGLLLRQAPTAGALLYTLAVVNGNINPLFLTAFSFLFLLEARLWLEIARLITLRWQRRDHVDLTRPIQNQVETLWSNDDVRSLEVGRKDYYEDSIEFSKHLLLTKFWFMRISWKNKRQLLLRLVTDVKSIWTLSVLLKSIWNCRPKDAVSSICGKNPWSSYDQVPMDHNRTALPVQLVEEAMLNERNWFSRLEPDQQALVISELLTVAGGPIMWEVLGTAQKIYEKHKELQLQEIIEYVVVEPDKAKPVTVEQPKKDVPRGKGSFSQGQDPRQTLLPGHAQKELDLALATWNSTVKSIRDGYKLEEIEMQFKDETKRTIWKVNRSKPENIETVDYLLPSVIAKQILLYIPQTQYGDLSRVNKYWSFLIDEIKAEILARQKINMDLEKLRDIILRYDTELGMMNALDSDLGTYAKASNTKATSVITKALPPFSMREKPRKLVGTFKPLRKLSDIYKRLDQRGAADKNIWKWCSNILKLNQQISDHNEVKNENEGTLLLGSLNFPCPLMAYNINIPLEYPLIEDPTMKITSKASERKRSRWNQNLSLLHPVTKVPSYIDFHTDIK